MLAGGGFLHCRHNLQCHCRYFAQKFTILFKQEKLNKEVDRLKNNLEERCLRLEKRVAVSLFAIDPNWNYPSNPTGGNAGVLGYASPFTLLR